MYLLLTWPRTNQERRCKLNEADILKMLQELTIQGLKHKSIAKLATIKMMIDLGNDWHDYREIQRGLFKYVRTGNVYVFELSRRYPNIIMKDSSSNEFKIVDEAFPIISKHINMKLELVLSKIEKARTHTSEKKFKANKTAGEE